MRSLVIISAVLVSVFTGCSKEPVLETDIPGLDLSKPQNADYFRKNIEASKEFNQWCKKTMIEPIPKDDVSMRFYNNCNEANMAILIPKTKIEGTRKYNSY